MVQKEEGYSLYLRPFIFASSECIKASASEEYTFIIITAPTKKLLSARNRPCY